MYEYERRVSRAAGHIVAVSPVDASEMRSLFGVTRISEIPTGVDTDLARGREIRYFDIKGEYTGLFSRALTSPDGKIRIPINESADENSQIEEYLHQYKGEGIQHMACGCRDIYATVEALRARGLKFMPSPPATYYEKVEERVPGGGEDVVRLQKNGILIDGEGAIAVGSKEGAMTKVLLQIFSANAISPIFFEFIQRKGDEGFGEGNFRALFVSIEEDQLRRGVLQPARAKGSKDRRRWIAGRLVAGND
jgi:4-hydroxyphenylpyruvate dioxygenase